MKVVIMAGGKGTRISSLFPNIPKSMIIIEGKPILQREIECLRDQGFNQIIITLNYLGQIIMDYFKDGSEFGVNIEYFIEKIPLGNAGALFKIKDRLTDNFLLLNADTFFNINLERFVNFHEEHQAIATIFTHPNNHPYDSGLIIADERNNVTKWLSKEDERPTWYKNRVNAGIHVISLKLLDMKINTERIDLDRQLLKPLAGTGKMFCYDSFEYIKDIGTPERYDEVCIDYNKGLINAKDQKVKQKAIFLDRDGTINKYVGFLSKIDEFILLPKVALAIRKINSAGYLAIVVTNQPVIARGETTFSELTEIHNKMETLLGFEGAYLDKIYFCPHHPDNGYLGEIRELKIACDCRKPQSGMLLKAAMDFNIDLNMSWIIGDEQCDIIAGRNVGCKFKKIGDRPIECASLLDAVNQIFEEENI